jgi:hypothetical protein
MTLRILPATRNWKQPTSRSSDRTTLPKGAGPKRKIVSRFSMATERWGRTCAAICRMAAFALLSQPVHADETSDLAQLVQNPIAKVISLPFQNNLNFGAGPNNDAQDVLNIQPVLPFNVGTDWNLIARAIIPVIHDPMLGPGTANTNGLGDTSLALYLSPAHPDGVIWGIGPAFTFPTASQRELGQGKFDAGISAVALTIRGPWLVGALITDVASVSGQSGRANVHQMLLQPFVNYNFPGGWYLASSPMITSNWEAKESQRWTVPLGGGGGRAFRVGSQAMNVQMQVFRNITKPTDAGDWTLRLQFQLLFPK